MSGSVRFDHAVILVPDLGRAMSYYASLGFAVTAGGVHQGGGTRNALIAFADGSYLELLAFTRLFAGRTLPLLGQLGLGRFIGGGKTPIEDRFRQRGLKGFGLIDYALNPASLEVGLTRLRREGIGVDGPFPGGRTRPESDPVAWEVALPNPRELPFLCADVTERRLRVPEGDATTHRNGVRGIAGITVAVESVETSSARYRALLGKEPDPGARERLRDARGRIFTVEGTEIIVATASASSHPLRKHLREHGEGPYMIHLRGSPDSRSQLLTGPKTQSVKLEITPGPVPVAGSSDG